jgi:Glycosyltransferase
MPDGFNIMFAGNIGVAQDFGTILTAAEKLKVYPDIKWVVIGDGRMRSWLESQIDRMGLRENIVLLGRYPTQSMPRFFSLADVLLLTLRKEPIFSLTIPSKLQSYFACAKPVIAAIDGEGARIVNEAGAGLSCPAEAPAALAESVLSMYRMSKDERALLGNNGRKYFENNFERSTLVSCIQIWMNEAVGRNNDIS